MVKYSTKWELRRRSGEGYANETGSVRMGTHGWTGTEEFWGTYDVTWNNDKNVS